MNKNIEKQREEIASTLIDILNSGKELDWRAGWFSSGFGLGDVNAVTKKGYKGSNLIATYLTRVKNDYKDNRWVTFNQAQDLKGNVKKGEKGLRLLKYEEIDKKTKRPPKWEEIRSLPEEEYRAYVKENIYAWAKPFVVFNVEQCENLNIPQLDDLKMSEEELLKNNEQIESIIKNSSAPIYHDGGNQAFYRLATDDIHLPSIEKFMTKQDYYATALHEIAHSTGHESRLNRNLNNSFGDKEYAKEELRAEISSIFTQAELGIKVEGKALENHGAYVNSWKEIANEPNVLFDVINEAKDITDYIKDNYLKEKTSSKENGIIENPKDFETPFTEALLDHFEKER
jgi:antirestriction protein ArdC